MTNRKAGRAPTALAACILMLALAACTFALAFAGLAPTALALADSAPAALAQDDSGEQGAGRETKQGSRQEARQEASPAAAMTVEPAVALPGDEVAFTATFGLGDVGRTAEMTFSDELPEGAEPLSVTVTGPNGALVTDEAGEASVDGRRVAYAFDPEWLAGALPTAGTLTFTVTARVTEGADGALANSATLSFGDGELRCGEAILTVLPAEAPEAAVAAASALRSAPMLAASGGQTFRAEPVPTDRLFEGGYYLERATDVDVELSRSDVSAVNGQIGTPPADAQRPYGILVCSSERVHMMRAMNLPFKVTATYRNYGDMVNSATGERTPVDIRTTIDVKAMTVNTHDSWWKGFMGSISNVYAYVVFNAPTMGISVGNITAFDQTWEFFKAGTDEPFNIDSTLWVMEQSLDKGEGFSAANVVNAYVSSTMPNRNDQAAIDDAHEAVDPSSYRSVVPGSNVYEFEASGMFGFMGSDDDTFTTHGGKFRWAEPDWPGEDRHQNLNDVQGGLGVHENTHLWAAGSLEVAMNGSNSLVVKNYQLGRASFVTGYEAFVNSDGMAFDLANGRHLGIDALENYGMKYYVTYFNALTGFVPPTGPVKAVDKAEAYVGETVTYTVEQPVGKWGGSLSQGTTYERLELTDAIPAGLTYVSGSLKAYDTQGADVTSRGTVTASGQSLKFAFGQDFLESGLAYDGGNVRFEFQCTVDAGQEGATFVNAGKTYINGYEFDTNPVTTTVPGPTEYYAPVKAVDKAEAQVGETVTYTVTQKVHAMADRPGGRAYSAMSFSDRIPAGLTFASFKVADQSGADVTAAAGALSQSGRDVGYAFEPTWLANSLAYDGGNLTFTITATVDAAAAGTTLKNTATTVVNSEERTSNEVVTVVPERTYEYYAPVKAVDKAEAQVGETVTYTISQKVHAMADRPGGAPYSAMSFSDQIPTGLTFKSFKVADQSGADITAASGTLSQSGRSVGFAFDSTWLANSLAYDGGNLTFTITATVDDSASGKTLKNKAVTTVNSEERTSNEVVTVVPEKQDPPVLLPLTGAPGDAARIFGALAVLVAGLTGFTVVRTRKRYL